MEQPQAGIARAEAELRRLINSYALWDDVCKPAAEKLARLLVDSGADQQETQRRLEAAGVAPKWAWPVVIEAERQAELAALEDSRAVCPHCMHPVEQFDHLCPNCAGPVTATASFDPMGIVYSAGRAYRQAATDPKSRGLVVLAMWLIFAPTIGVVVWVISSLAVSTSPRPERVYAIDVDGNGNKVLRPIVPGESAQETTRAIRVGHEGQAVSPSDTVFQVISLTLALGVIVLYCAILWKVTVRWLRPRPPTDGDDVPADFQPPVKTHC